MSKVHKHGHGAHHVGHGAGKADDRKDPKADGAKHEKQDPAAKLPGWRHDFDAVDKNQDGKLAKSELKMQGVRAFDKDGSGTVTKAEFRAGHRQANSFTGLDHDHDGALSAGEMKKLDRLTKTSYDGDGDGKVSETEFVAGQRQEHAALKEARRDARFGALTQQDKQGLKRYDADHDGKITRAEYGAGKDKDWADARTAKIDANFAAAGAKDGVLDVAKAKAYKDYDQDADGHVTADEFLKGQLADRRQYWTDNLTGKSDAMRAKRLDLDALGQGINHVDGAAPAGSTTGPSAPASAKGDTDLVISSFNLLGSSHTTAGGKHPDMASGPQRMNGAVQLIKQHDVDIVGFQEMQNNQAQAFKKKLGKEYGLFPGPGKASENSIAWSKKKWDMVKGQTIQIPYFNGHAKSMPVVLLRNKQTGQTAYFTNFHNPADTAQFHHQQKYRTAAMHKEIDLVNKLRKQSGLPVFVTGDMNEGTEYFNGMTKGAKGMHASAQKNGRIGKHPGIDWVFGSEGVKFTRHIRDRGALVKRTTDHPMIVAHATIQK